MDKSGTLTEGKPEMTRIVTAPGFDERELLGLAASLEHSSEHQFAAAIVRAARRQNIALADPADFQSVTEEGVKRAIGGSRLALGNARLMAAEAASPGDLATAADELRASGATAIFIAVDGKPAGTLAIAYPIKPSTSGAPDELQT